MRITFLLPSANLSGGTRVVATYGDRLTRRGHDVRVLCPRPVRPSWRRRLRTFRAARAWSSPPKCQHFDGKRVSIEQVEGPIGEGSTPDADVVIATWWETAEWAAELSDAKGAKVYFVQGHEVHAHVPLDRARATYRLPMKKICVSRWLADLMRDEYGDASCTVVPNAVEMSQFYMPASRQRGLMTVGFMYSKARLKGCDVCVEAIRIAKRRNPRLRAVSFGKRKPGDPSTRAVINEYYASPAQDKLREIYGKCDAWLFASRSEGFGLPILEAMACRTPVIGVPMGAAPDLIPRGGGVLVNPEDPEDMARAIIEVASLSDGEWRAMSDAAYRTAAACNWDHATLRFEEALRDAVARAATSAACEERQSAQAGATVS